MQATPTVPKSSNRRLYSPMQPVTVLHLIETGGPGGAERMLLSLSSHLTSPFQSIIALLKAGWLYSQVSSLRVPGVLLHKNGMRDFGVLISLLQTVRRHHVGIIHAHEFYMNAMGALVSMLSGIPLIATIHGKNYYPEKLRRRLLYRLIACRAKGIVAVSHDLKKFFCQQTGVADQRVHVIYNGIDIIPFLRSEADPARLESVGVPRYARVIGAVGNLYPVKGHVILIRAIAKVLETNHDVHAVILGRGSEEAAIRNQARTLGIEGRIHLAGYRDDATEWLGSFDVFVMPSFSEGTPLSLLEAMAAGRPIVITAVGGIPEIVKDGETAFLVPPGNADALADKIRIYLDHQDIASSMGIRARERAHGQYSLARMVSEYEKLYRCAVG